MRVRFLAWVATWGRRRPFYVFSVAALLSVATAASGATATLLEAVEQGNRPAALRLLAGGANPNTPGPDGTTPLMWAAAHADLDLVRALIRAKANVSAKNHFGTT